VFGLHNATIVDDMAYQLMTWFQRAVGSGFRKSYGRSRPVHDYLQSQSLIKMVLTLATTSRHLELYPASCRRGGAPRVLWIQATGAVCEGGAPANAKQTQIRVSDAGSTAGYKALFVGDAGYKAARTQSTGCRLELGRNSLHHPNRSRNCC